MPTKPPVKRGNPHGGELSKIDAIAIYLLVKELNSYQIEEVAKAYGITPQAVTNIVEGRSWKREIKDWQNAVEPNRNQIIRAGKYKIREYRAEQQAEKQQPKTEWK